MRARNVCVCSLYMLQYENIHAYMYANMNACTHTNVPASINFVTSNVIIRSIRVREHIRMIHRYSRI
jgi:hypothetical protein